MTDQNASPPGCIKCGCNLPTESGVCQFCTTPPADRPVLPAGITPLPWHVESQDTETGFGTGKTYAVVDADGKTIVDAHNSEVAVIHTEDDEGHRHRWDEQGRVDCEFIARACNAYAAQAQPAPVPSRAEAEAVSLAKRMADRVSPMKRDGLLPLDSEVAQDYDEAFRIAAAIAEKKTIS